ncbi:MAG: chorismate mutase [Solobacterium sp.]|nr:chorismate mutase [Solobacterium sp.]
MTNRLEEYRKIIDECDQEFAELFEKRFHIVKKIIEYKIENQLPILDKGREDEIIKKNRERIQDEELKKYFSEVYQKMIEASRLYQSEIKGDE